MNELIQKISQKHFQLSADKIDQILDKGKVNDVYKVLINGTNYIFRFNSKDYLNSYQKEFFCIKKAAESGVPVSEAYFVDTEEEYSYMILNYIEGINGVDSEEEEFKKIYKTLGGYAKKFNSIEVNGFGRNVKNEKDGFFESWKDFNKSKIDFLFGDGVLVKNNVITEKQSEFIQNRLSEMEAWDSAPKLCHGNMHISNTIVSPDGTVYLIDWGNGVGHLAPHVDLADIIAWRTSREYLDYFLEGYGMSQKEYEEIEHDLNNILIIQLLDVIKRGIEMGKEFKEGQVEGFVERIMNLE